MDELLADDRFRCDSLLSYIEKYRLRRNIQTIIEGYVAEITKSEVNRIYSFGLEMPPCGHEVNQIEGKSSVLPRDPRYQLVGNILKKIKRIYRFRNRQMSEDERTELRREQVNLKFILR